MRVSVVLANWRRPGNVHTICRSYREANVHDVTVVDCSGKREPFPAECVIRYDRDPGLYARFTAACLARHELVLVQDDDILLPRATVQALFQSASESPYLVHGLFGRSPKPDGSYSVESNRVNADVRVVLTRALVTSRLNFARFFEHCYEPDVEEVQRDSVPYGNGEDMILSYVASRYTGLPNKTYALERAELDAPDAIHRRPGCSHWSHRTRLMRVLERSFPIDKSACT